MADETQATYSMIVLPLLCYGCNPNHAARTGLSDVILILDSELGTKLISQQSSLESQDRLEVHLFLSESIGTLTELTRQRTSGKIEPAHEAAPRIRAEAQKALDLDPSLPEAHAMLGIVAFVYDYDWTEADRQFRLAMSSEPVRPLVRDWYAAFYMASTGRAAEALRQVDRAMREDPLNPMFHCNRSRYLDAIGQHNEAEVEFRRTLELNPNFYPAYILTVGHYLARGMPEQELAWAEAHYALGPGRPIAIGHLAGMLMRTGQTARARQLLSQIESGREYAQPLGLVIYYILVSDLEKAADWMERAIEQRVPGAAAHRLVPIYAALHASPRWPKLAALMNLPPEESLV